LFGQTPPIPVRHHAQYDSEAEWQPSPGKVILWDEALDLEVQVQQTKTFRVDELSTYTVCLSPFTKHHLEQRLRYYHRLDNGASGLLENGRRDKPVTYFKKLQVLCLRCSSEEITGPDAPCPACELRERLCKNGLSVNDEHVFDGLEPFVTVTLEIGIITIDGVEQGSRATHTLELPVKAFPRVGVDEAANLEYRLFRDRDHRMVLEPTGRRVNAQKPYHRFGKIVIFKPHTDKFVRDLCDTMWASKFAGPEPWRTDWLSDLFPEATLVPCWWGTKHPMRSGYHEFATRWMKQRRLYVPVLDNSNINFLCGPKSGNLVSFDCDQMSQWRRWSDKNQWSLKAPKVWGKRGAAVIFRMKGKYPLKVFKLKLAENGEDIGELRLGNCLQTLSGLHTSGIPYRLEPGRVREIEFEEFRLLSRWKPLQSEEPKTAIVRRDRCQLDIARLNFVTDKGCYYDAQCPSCARHKKDTAHDNLRIWKAGWGFKCIAGCEREDILALVGREKEDGISEEEGDRDYEQ
jgi:hypothetical protein